MCVVKFHIRKAEVVGNTFCNKVLTAQLFGLREKKEGKCLCLLRHTSQIFTYNLYSQINSRNTVCKDDCFRASSACSLRFIYFFYSLYCSFA